MFAWPISRDDDNGAGGLHSNHAGNRRTAGTESQQAMHGVASAPELALVERLFLLPEPESRRSVVFCGAEEGDGAAEVAARTAEALASLSSQPVCLIDADTFAPSLHLRYGLESHSNLVNAKSDFSADRAHDTANSNLWVLPAAEMRCLTSLHLRQYLAVLQERFENLLLIAPPISLSAEGLVLGQLTDGVVLVLKAQSTRRVAALKARQILESNNVHLLGAVLNEAQPANTGSVSRKLFHLAGALSNRKSKRRRDQRPEGVYTGRASKTQSNAVPIFPGGDHEC